MVAATKHVHVPLFGRRRYLKLIEIYREHRQFLYSIFLECKSVLGAKFSSAYIKSTGASKYIKIVKNHYPTNFQNFPKLCITFNKNYTFYCKDEHGLHGVLNDLQFKLFSYSYKYRIMRHKNVITSYEELEKAHVHVSQICGLIK